MSGSADITFFAASGKASSENMVPHRNVIGRMTKLLNRFILGRSCTIMPAATPSMENTVHDISMQIISRGVICRSSARKNPSRSISDPHIMLLMMPSMDFPSIMDVLDMGQRSISSKLS